MKSTLNIVILLLLSLLLATVALAASIPIREVADGLPLLREISERGVGNVVGKFHFKFLGVGLVVREGTLLTSDLELSRRCSACYTCVGDGFN